MTLHDVTGIVPANIVLNPGSATPGIIRPTLRLSGLTILNGDAGEESKRIISLPTMCSHLIARITRAKSI